MKFNKLDIYVVMLLICLATWAALIWPMMILSRH